MEQTWRWYGPDDPVSLNDIRQAGATGIVTALHHIPNGEIWTKEEIQKRKALIEEKSLTWSVVESVPLHEDIKRHSGNFNAYIDNYKQSILNLAQCDIQTLCYNFMPVLDWTRTDLAYPLPDGSRALRFDHIAFAAFDIHILQRPGAEDDYSDKDKLAALQYFEGSTKHARQTLTKNIIAGLPGAEEGYTLDAFRTHLASYDGIDKTKLREHLAYFLAQIIPVCEETGMRLAIHPDDPPRPLLGLPRIISTKEDIAWLMSVSDSISNGITMCTGSYGVHSDNDLINMIQHFGNRIYFAHLRATQREENPLSFYEASHLVGDVDMYGVILEILKEENRRRESGEEQLIPIRPDHGHQILDDLNKTTNPGYSAIGRLKGLAEIRGMEMAIKRAIFD
ncbi:MAG: mannonate dehydratase [Agarilytica sp.]